MIIALKNLFKSRRERIDKNILSELFRVETNILITLILLDTVILYILTPLLGNIIIVWYALIVALSLWRLYNAYTFKINPNRDSIEIWYKKFIIQLLATAILFSILALFAIPKLDTYYQLFLFIIIVGVCSGEVKALTQIYKIAIIYISIILLPLIIEMLFLMRIDSYILAFLLIIYLLTQISIILNAYQKREILKEKEKEIAKINAKLYEKQILLHRFFQQASEALFSYDRDINLLDCNDSFLKLFSISSKDEILGKNLSNIFDEKLTDIIYKTLIEDRRIYKSEFFLDNNLWIEIKLSTIKDNLNHITGGIGIIEDKTKEYKAKQELEYLVTHDHLTSILNRRGFQEYMNNLFQDERHSYYYSLLLYFDLNRFKQVNDMYGHEMGDKVLIETTTKLKKTIEKDFILARLGGDEFCLVMPFIGIDENNSFEKLYEWVNIARAEFNDSIIIEGKTLDIGYSIGAVIISPKENDIEKIIRSADIAMFNAKKSGEDGTLTIYNEEFGKKYEKLYQLQKDLNSAYEQFELFFQPILSIKDNSIYAVEASVKWQHPKEGLLDSKEFMEIIYKSGKITDFDEFILNKTFATVAEWKRVGVFNTRYLSINIDIRTLFRKDILSIFKQLQNRYNLYNGEIRLEIKESSLINNSNEAKYILEKLSDIGIDCSIDDFGVGCSSLLYLKKLSFRSLKIYKSFVRDIAKEIENLFLLKTIIEMGVKLNYEVIVEGVENSLQRDILKRINNEIYYQGFLISEPLSEDRFIEQYLKEESNEA